jgi:hypothetical protein
MHDLVLDDEERQALASLVRVRLDELAVEVSRTDSRDFREGLLREWAVLERVSLRLRAQELPAHGAT